MKSLFTIIILLTGILSTNLLAQTSLWDSDFADATAGSFITAPWHYDFAGATAGSFITANTASETFLPDPPAGIDRVYVGIAGGGFELVNSGGSDFELQITASTLATNGNINKFSVYDYTSDSTFSIGFNIRFECLASDNGAAYFLFGDGNYFSDSVRYEGADIFTGFRWEKSIGDSFLQMEVLNTGGTGWFDINQDLSLNTEYYIEVFGNNTDSTTIIYDYNGPQTLAAYSYDLWINGSIVVDNRVRSANTMNDGDPIDSYMFLAEGSAGNQLVVIVDNITYSNQVEPGPIPVELTSFTAALNGNDIDLQWQTATETNNSGFEILRFDQNDNYGWEKISFVPGHGTTTASKNYSFTDENVLPGIYSYRLKQIDLDGSFSYSEIIEVEVTAPLVFSLEQNYPNPFNPTTNIKFQIADFGSVSLKIYDVLGNEVAQLVNEEKEAGTYNYNWDASNLTSGIYFYILQAGDFIKTKKMILLK